MKIAAPIARSAGIPPAGEEAGALRTVPLRLEATRPEPAALETGTARLPTPPVTRVKLRAAPSASRDAEMVSEPISTAKGTPATPARPDRPEPSAEASSGGMEIPGSALTGSVRQRDTSPVPASAEMIAPRLEPPEPSFPARKPPPSPTEPRWSEPSTAHWPKLPDSLPTTRPSGRPGPSRASLRPDHALRLNQEQKGKPWNA